MKRSSRVGAAVAVAVAVAVGLGGCAAPSPQDTPAPRAPARPEQAAPPLVEPEAPPEPEPQPEPDAEIDPCFLTTAQVDAAFAPLTGGQPSTIQDARMDFSFEPNPWPTCEYTLPSVVDAPNSNLVVVGVPYVINNFHGFGLDLEYGGSTSAEVYETSVAALRGHAENDLYFNYVFERPEAGVVAGQTTAVVAADGDYWFTISLMNTPSTEATAEMLLAMGLVLAEVRAGA